MRVQAVCEFIAPGEKGMRKCGEIFEVTDEEAAEMIHAGQVKLYEESLTNVTAGGEYKGTVSDPDRKPEWEGTKDKNPGEMNR